MFCCLAFLVQYLPVVYPSIQVLALGCLLLLCVLLSQLDLSDVVDDGTALLGLDQHQTRV